MASTVIDRATGVALISAIKAPCVAATTANITLYGEQTIDGVAVVSGDRVLVKNQTAAAENGVYVVDTGGWDRAPDFDSSRDIQQYVRVYVGAGSENANTEWVLTTDSPVPGTTALSFSSVYAFDAADQVLLTSLAGLVDIETFLTGDGTTDNASSIASMMTYMAANPQKIYWSKPGRVFRTTVGGFTLPNNVTIRLQGATFLLDGDVSSGTFFLKTGVNNNIDAITVNVASGRSLYRGIFIDQGARIVRACVTSVSQQANTGNLAYGAVVIGGSDVIVGEVTVQNFDRAMLLYSYGGLGVLSDASVTSVRIKNYVCGIYIRNWRRVSISDYNITGRSPNALPAPGQNGVLIEGAEYVRLSNGLIADAGEHGFRSGGFRDSDAGTGSFVYETKQLTVDTLQIYGSGQSGFKIWASSTTKYHRDVSLSNIQIVDCGNNGDALGFNDMGFMLQAIDGLTVSGCSVGKRALSYSAYDGFFLSGISRCIISGCRSYGASRNGLRISEFSDDASLDAMAINTLDISQFTADVQGAQGIYINFSGSSSIRDMMITAAHIVTCTNGVEANALAARFFQPCYVSAFIRGNSGSKFVVPTTTNLKTVDMTV